MSQLMNEILSLPKRKYKKREMNEARAKALANNEIHFQGNPCKKGHSGIRNAKEGCCIECRKLNRKLNWTKERTRDWELKKSFGITRADYNEILKKQNGVCAICRQPETTLSNYKTIKELAVDHCHETGKIRGLLCLTCNVGIGYLKHNPERLRQAALYCEQT